MKYLLFSLFCLLLQMLLTIESRTKNRYNFKQAFLATVFCNTAYLIVIRYIIINLRDPAIWGLYIVFASVGTLLGMKVSMRYFERTK